MRFALLFVVIAVVIILAIDVVRVTRQAERGVSITDCAVVQVRGEPQVCR